MTGAIALERIWAEEPEVFDGMGFWQERKADDLIEYVRADVHAAALDREAALREALDEIRAKAKRDMNAEYFIVADAALQETKHD